MQRQRHIIAVSPSGLKAQCHEHGAKPFYLGAIATVPISGFKDGVFDVQGCKCEILT
jgi:hypothetical protein